MHLDVLGLGQHEDPGRAGVDPSLGLGDGHPLDAVHPSFVLPARPRPLPGRRDAARLDRHGDVLVATEVGLGRLEQLGAPARPLGEAGVHPQQVTGEQRRLLAALPRLDLHDDVTVVVGVGGEQSVPQPLGQLVTPDLELGELAAEGGVLGRELPGRLDVPAGSSPRRMGLDQRRQLGVAPAEATGLALVGVHLGVGQAQLQLRVLTEQLLDSLEHGLSSARRDGQGTATTTVPGDDSCPTAHAKRRRCPATPGGRRSPAPSGRYFAAVLVPKRRSKRATRPPVSRIFCLPV